LYTTTTTIIIISSSISILVVIVLPSKIGFDSNNLSLTLSISAELPLTAAIYSIINFEASVLPAPLSPLIIIHWSFPCSRKFKNAVSATV